MHDLGGRWAWSGLLLLCGVGLLAPPGAAVVPFLPVTAPLLFAGDASLGTGCTPNRAGLILSGCGTVEDPYVLENIEIVFTELLTPALEFRDTTKHVLVRNVFIHDVPYLGIVINGDNVTLESVVVARGKSGGIVVGFAHMVTNTEIRESIVRESVAAGVSLYQARDFELRDSLVEANSDGINIGSATAPITIKNNDVSDNRRNGIYIHNCCFDVNSNPILIADNTIGGNAMFGLRSKDSVSLTFNGNNIEGNAQGGLQVDDSSPVVATNNWWGAASGPSGAGPGTGQAISLINGGTASWDPWLGVPSAAAGPSQSLCEFVVHAYECLVEA